MQSDDKHRNRKPHAPSGQEHTPCIYGKELRKRYGDELRAMNHVSEELADTSDLTPAPPWTVPA